MSILVLVFLPAIFTMFLLLFWRYCCETKFPALGHFIIIVLFSFLPVLNWAIFIILIVVYSAGRLTGNISLRKNKFNKIFFN